MNIDLSSYIQCSCEEAVEQVKRPRLLQHVAAPLVSFIPVARRNFPSIWSRGTYSVNLKLLGFILFGNQDIVISYPNIGVGFALRDNGRSALIRRWDHMITILQTSDGVPYRDTAVISAGLFTPVIWLYDYFF